MHGIIAFYTKHAFRIAIKTVSQLTFAILILTAKTCQKCWNKASRGGGIVGYTS